MDILNNENQIINEAKFEDHIGKEMVHLVKFKEIPQYASASWINSVSQGSGDFIKAWNENKDKREKFAKDVNKSLDDAYKKALAKEERAGNDVSKLPKERPEEYTFEMLTNQDDVKKYMDDHVIDKNFKILIYRDIEKNRASLKYDINGGKIKKYR